MESSSMGATSELKEVAIIIPGHKYVLPNFENKTTGQTIQFINKKPKENPSFEGEMETVNDGTTNEFVLQMLIDRMKFLQAGFPCRENAIVITKLEESLMWLEKRTSDRVKRNV